MIGELSPATTAPEITATASKNSFAAISSLSILLLGEFSPFSSLHYILEVLYLFSDFCLNTLIEHVIFVKLMIFKLPNKAQGDILELVVVWVLFGTIVSFKIII